jgi:hypothetical protein
VIAKSFDFKLSDSVMEQKLEYKEMIKGKKKIDKSE